MALTEYSPPHRPSGVHWSARLMRFPIYGLFNRYVVAQPVASLALLLGLPFVWVISLNVLPLFEMARISVFEIYPLPAGTAPSFTLSHYWALMTEPIYYRPFLRTFVFAATVVVGALITMLPIAYFLAKGVTVKWQIRLLLLVLTPSWAGEVIRVFSYVLLLSNNGAINLLLKKLGLIEHSIPLLYSWFSLSTGTLYVMSIFMLVPLYAAIEKVPNQVLEAASDLGANGMQRFFRITLPLIRDGIAIGCTLVFLMATGIYTVPAILAGTDTNLFSQVIGLFFSEYNLQWPRGAAFSIMLFSTALVLSALIYTVISSNKKTR